MGKFTKSATKYIIPELHSEIKQEKVLQWQNQRICRQWDYKRNGTISVLIQFARLAVSLLHHLDYSLVSPRNICSMFGMRSLDLLVCFLLKTNLRRKS